MINRDLVERAIGQFQESDWNFYLFYKAYFLAKQGVINQHNFKIDEDAEEERIKQMNFFYFGALKRAIETTHKKKDDTQYQYNLRVRRRYFELRKASFKFLQQKVREDYKVIYKFLKQPDPRAEEQVLSIDEDNVVAVVGDDYYG